jgi:hypothetical protein
MGNALSAFSGLKRESEREAPLSISSFTAMLEGLNERSKHRTLRKVRTEMDLNRSAEDGAPPNTVLIPKLCR